jgi:hypothetical protein
MAGVMAGVIGGVIRQRWARVASQSLHSNNPKAASKNNVSSSEEREAWRGLNRKPCS